MKKSIALVLSLFSVASMLFSCGNQPSDDNKCDPDDMFCDNDDEKPTDTITLEDDLSNSYNLDKTVTNINGSCNYEIFVRSFYDSDGDGIGDLNGVTYQLPYLFSLGVKNLWLMPINPSPSYHGYDVKDYYGINPDYGTFEDFKNLVKEAKKYNIGIILDEVFNHCSNQSQWFIDSYNDYKSNNTSIDSKKDWFNWSEVSKSGYNQYGGLYYESRFSSTMPDLNLDNEDVLKEIEDICKFWIENGVEGFRLDAVLYYYFGNTTANVKFLNWLQETCNKYKENFYIVGECWDNQTIINKYYTSNITSLFSFPSSLASATDGSIVGCVKGVNDASKFASYIETQEANMKSINANAVSSYFLSNHDMDRSSNNLTGTYAKTAASVTYLLPGTPYIYYGEEIGLLGVRKTSPEDASDARRRLPMVWSSSNKTGLCDFPESSRLDLDNNTQVSKGVEDNLSDPYSLTSHYLKVLNVRNKFSIIKDGTFKDLSSVITSDNKRILAYEIIKDDQKIVIIHNLSSIGAKVKLNSVSNKILDSINTSKKIPSLKDDTLLIGGYSSVVLNCVN